ncbi:MAG: hypothetical protein LKG53_05135 [Lachnospiraceae bacterium]|jgi:uncharacterized membrane protein YadS|nr:hypothetical protein [Lachnospiraceae bacterium]
MAKNKYTFIKKVAPAAKESLILSTVSLGLLVADVIISCAMKGNGGALLGAIGLFAMLVAMYGFYLGIRAISDRGTNYLITALGTIFAGIMSIIWLGVFFLGMP